MLGQPPVKLAITQPGDLWSLGKQATFCAPSIEPHSFALLMQGERAAMAFDAPYNGKIGGLVSGLGTTNHRESAMASGAMDRRLRCTAFADVWPAVDATFGLDWVSFCRILLRSDGGG